MQFACIQQVPEEYLGDRDRAEGGGEVHPRHLRTNE